MAHQSEIKEQVVVIRIYHVGGCGELTSCNQFARLSRKSYRILRIILGKCIKLVNLASELYRTHQIHIAKFDTNPLEQIGMLGLLKSLSNTIDVGVTINRTCILTEPVTTTFLGSFLLGIKSLQTSVTDGGVRLLTKAATRSELMLVAIQLITIHIREAVK